MQVCANKSLGGLHIAIFCTSPAAFGLEKRSVSKIPNVYSCMIRQTSIAIHLSHKCQVPDLFIGARAWEQGYLNYRLHDGYLFNVLVQSHI